MIILLPNEIFLLSYPTTVTVSFKSKTLMGGWGKIKKITYFPHEMSSILISVNFHPKEPFWQASIDGR